MQPWVRLRVRYARTPWRRAFAIDDLSARPSSGLLPILIESLDSSDPSLQRSAAAKLRQWIAADSSGSVGAALREVIDAGFSVSSRIPGRSAEVAAEILAGAQDQASRAARDRVLAARAENKREFDEWREQEARRKAEEAGKLEAEEALHRDILTAIWAGEHERLLSRSDEDLLHAFVGATWERRIQAVRAARDHDFPLPPAILLAGLGVEHPHPDYVLTLIDLAGRNAVVDAVPLLVRLADNPAADHEPSGGGLDQAKAGAAIRALAMIGTAEAVQVLRKIVDHSSGFRFSVAAHVLVEKGETLPTEQVRALLQARHMFESCMFHSSLVAAVAAWPDPLAHEVVNALASHYHASLSSPAAAEDGHRHLLAVLRSPAIRHVDAGTLAALSALPDPRIRVQTGGGRYTFFHGTEEWLEPTFEERPLDCSEVRTLASMEAGRRSEHA
jgi:hypothetical protein